MTERERLVEDVVKASDSVVARWRKDYGKALPQYNRALNEEPQALWNAIDALRAHDAAPKPTPAVEPKPARATGDGYTALGLIRNERRRQQSAEGWTIEHDDEHTGGELAEAAACYALPPDLRQEYPRGPQYWPWDAQWWKPTPNDRIRELVKAGALIVAEIERLQRAGEQPTPAGETPVLDGDKPATVGWCHEFLSSAISDILDQNTSLASRVAEVERSVAQCHSHIDEIERSAEVNSDNCGILFRDALDRDEKMQNDIAALRRDVEAMKAKRDEPAVRRVYPCGCVPCVCEDQERCHGCGAKSCGRGDRCKAKAPTPSPPPLPFGCVAHQCNDGNWLIRSGDYYWGLGRWEREPRNFAHGAFPTEAKALADFHATNGGKVPPPDSDAGRGSDMAKKKWPRCEDCGNELTYCGPMSIDGPKADCPLCQSRDKTRAAEARATAAEERCKRLEEALTRHKHTDECLAYAASTGKSFCIAPCMDARTALAREGEKA